MTAAIVSIVASITGFIIWLWKRKVETKDTALTYEKELHNAIGSGSERDVNLLLDKRLSELSRNQSGQGGSEIKEGQGISDAK